MERNRPMRLVLVLGLAGALSLFMAQRGSAVLTGSAHDFSGQSWNTTGQACIVCHTPHNSQTLTEAPLWNHATTTATFTLYTSPTLNATVGQPAGVSKLCLSFHDGTVALDSFGGRTGTQFMGGSERLGTDLSNDHPISFTYDTALATADVELWDPATKLVTLGNGSSGTIQVKLLFNNKVECASCHDVHNGPEVVSGTKLLRAVISGSNLCLSCHKK